MLGAAEERGRRSVFADPEALARRFHETYERLAPEYGYETRKESAVPWEKVPEKNRRLMIAVCAAIGGVDSESVVTLIADSKGVATLITEPIRALAPRDSAPSCGADEDGIHREARKDRP